MMITHYDIINAEMELNYLGTNSFKLKNKAEVILVNPTSNRERGDVVVTTGFDKLPVIASVSRSEVFVVNEEGEYELGGIGIIMDRVNGGTIVYFFIDAVKIAYIDGTALELSERQLEKLNESDVMLVSVNIEKGLLGKLDPYILVPYGQSNSAEVEKFISENKFGTVVPNLDKIKLDTQSLPEDTQVWVLNA